MGNSNSFIYNYCKAEDGKGQEKRAEENQIWLLLLLCFFCIPPFPSAIPAAPQGLYV